MNANHIGGVRRSLRAAADKWRLRGRSSSEAILVHQIAKLERRLEDMRHKLSSADVDHSAVLLDYSKAEIRLVSSARKRRRACEKEPFTVQWLEDTLAKNDVVYDIGANVGAYALIAGTIAPIGTRVYAFEPAYANFAALCENIVLNGLTARITPLPVTLGRETRIATFRYRDLRAGTARHHSNDDDAPAGFVSLYDQPVLAFRLDDVLRQFALPAPTHIKLDVDGAEADVLAGAAATLSDPRLRTVMVEIEKNVEDRVTPQLADAGFRVTARYEKPGVWYARCERKPSRAPVD